MTRTGEDGERLLIVGAGLIGTSVGLAATAAGYRVSIDDQHGERRATAVAVGAGALRGAGDDFDLALVAVPPRAVAAVVEKLLVSDTASAVTHVTSVQYQVQVEVEARCAGDGRFVGSHPIAGRERSGPHHGDGDLFVQRPWVICPTAATRPDAIAAVERLAKGCGAVPTIMTAAAHDALLARLSHAPQLVASALAGSLGDLDRAEAALAGSGVRDTSRLADSEPDLWGEIVAANPAEVSRALRAVVEPLTALADVLDNADPDAARTAVQALVERGRAGRRLLAGKHGQPAVRWATVSVVVPDEPGALARLLVDAAAVGVNVEDIRVDHSPGRPFGVVELDVDAVRGEPLAAGLGTHGWSASAALPPRD
jgi:prephenate dehydrogenase